MAFEHLGATEYRALDNEAFEARKKELQDLLLDPEAEVDMKEVRSEMEIVRDEAERRAAADELRRSMERRALSGGMRVTERADFGGKSGGAQVLEAPEDPHDTPEYRDAFIDYVRTGRPSGVLLRMAGAEDSGNGMLTSDAKIAIPTTLSNTAIERLDEHDDIYALVSKTSFQGGYEIPIDEFDFLTHWVGEEEVSDWQKAGRKDKIVFSYHEFESRFQQSFLSSIVTMDNFQSKLMPKMEKSISRTLSQAIIRGTGSGQPLGILNDPRVEHVVEMTEADFRNWKAWHSIFDADIDPEYDDGSLLMSKGSWNKYIDTMSDKNDAPVNVTYDPVTGKRSQVLVGKQTRLVKPVTLPDFDKAAPGDVVGVYGTMNDYAINWQPGGSIAITRYPDWDKRKNKMVGYGVCDGRVVDPYGFILIKKKASA